MVARLSGRPQAAAGLGQSLMREALRAAPEEFPPGREAADWLFGEVRRLARGGALALDESGGAVAGTGQAPRRPAVARPIHPVPSTPALRPPAGARPSPTRRRPTSIAPVDPDEEGRAIPLGRLVLAGVIVSLIAVSATLLWAVLAGGDPPGRQQAMTVMPPTSPPPVTPEGAAPQLTSSLAAASRPPDDVDEPAGAFGMPDGIVALASPEPPATLRPPAPVIVEVTTPGAPLADDALAVAQRRLFPRDAAPPSAPQTPPPLALENQDSARFDGEGGAAPPTARIFIHYTDASDSRRAAAERLATRLIDAGFEVVAVRSVRGQIERGSIRYFRGPDDELGRGLLRAVDAAAPDTAWQLVDFTAYPRPPRPGTLEIWLPSQLTVEAG